MSDPSLTLAPADDGSLAYVEELLEANGLPSRDVRTAPGAFYVARDGAERIGVGGVERRGGSGLLRSVAVEEPKRGRGYGTALCDALEAEATADGVDALYLLTTTAADFFAARGYAEIPREEIPAEIRATSQFEGLCPSTAVCLWAEL
ncbi:MULTISPECIES: arsenic resistance N-acetyltransferase ArsN2 [Halorubrum]|uniref:Amino-acid N-acetyltransferase n=1 Tax=Halorubrum sodomense TaxID=35743 RepID=A0A1I6FMR3_HALSD|nr:MULTISPECIES: arsenic resistance N-acetyltransferase ArsN2 [Halorubrum]TKX55460.1 GNAT family N-acetyltransferase [Halorubrum sp. SP3]TKX70665.1 GNAT family N-acetyltransferase [Halorubrum sp. SP9]SFR31107.1 amino-acid N-acetyltransferase [Halorubrum sodomense]